MENKLYYNKKEDVHYYLDDNKECDICGSKIEEAIVIKIYWDKLGSGIRCYCFNCRNKDNILASVVENYVAVITDIVDNDCTPVFISKPVLGDTKNLSTFDISGINSLGGTTVDKTVYANRKDSEVDEYLIDYSKDKVLDDNELELFIDGVKSSNILTFDDKEVKRLE